MTEHDTILAFLCLISHTGLYAFETEHTFLYYLYFSLFHCNRYMEVRVINTC